MRGKLAFTIVTRVSPGCTRMRRGVYSVLSAFIRKQHTRTSEPHAQLVSPGFTGSLATNQANRPAVIRVLLDSCATVRLSQKTELSRRCTWTTVIIASQAPPRSQSNAVVITITETTAKEEASRKMIVAKKTPRVHCAHCAKMITITDKATIEPAKNASPRT